MLQDKAMVNDVLSMIKSDLTGYATAITECANPTLRNALQQIRNADECAHYELFQLAQSKGYYMPASQANDTEVSQVRSQLQS